MLFGENSHHALIDQCFNESFSVWSDVSANPCFFASNIWHVKATCGQGNCCSQTHHIGLSGRTSNGDTRIGSLYDCEIKWGYIDWSILLCGFKSHQDRVICIDNAACLMAKLLSYYIHACRELRGWLGVRVHCNYWEEILSSIQIILSFIVNAPLTTQYVQYNMLPNFVYCRFI